jgi:hypothetical protein
MRSLGLAIVLCVAACASAKSGSGADGGSGTGTDAANGTADAPTNNQPDANSCGKQPCSLAPQCGCAAGKACDLDPNNLATGGTVCATAGNGGEANTCTTDGDCKPGYTCVGSPARCEKWCGGDSDCTSGPGALCIINIVYGNPQMNVPGAMVCTTDCDPSASAPAGCPATWGCHVYQEQTGAKRYLTDCDPSGGVGAGGTCTGNPSCVPGEDCITVTRGGVPSNECHPSCICPSNNCAAGSCPAGTGSCQAFTPAVMIGTREYGTCL